MYQPGYGVSGYDMTLEVSRFCVAVEKELIFAQNSTEIEQISTSGVVDNYNQSKICQTLKYLNVPITLYADNIDKHAVEYAVDKTTETFGSKEVKVYLCHNSNDDTTKNSKSYFMFSSLDLTPIFEHYQKDDIITIKLIYKDLQKTEQTLSIYNIKVIK
jgi:hypothetical protein